VSDIAVVVTCNELDLKWLPEALGSIDRQRPEAAERVVVFDRCKSPAVNAEPWRFIAGDWGHPAGC
jgi:hypothetical protein